MLREEIKLKKNQDNPCTLDKQRYICTVEINKQAECLRGDTQAANEDGL